LYDSTNDVTYNFANAIVLKMYVDPGQYGYLSVADFTSVPEPATMSLLGLGALAALRRRR
jgi:hypothetical protein